MSAKINYKEKYQALLAAVEAALRKDISLTDLTKTVEDIKQEPKESEAS